MFARSFGIKKAAPTSALGAKMDAAEQNFSSGAKKISSLNGILKIREERSSPEDSDDVLLP